MKLQDPLKIQHFRTQHTEIYAVPVFTLSLQALLREKQKTEELEKTKEAIKQLIQDAAVRTRKEVRGLLNVCRTRLASVDVQIVPKLKP